MTEDGNGKLNLIENGFRPACSLHSFGKTPKQEQKGFAKRIFTKKEKKGNLNKKFGRAKTFLVVKHPKMP